MIGFIEGVVLKNLVNKLLIKVPNGIGYEISASSTADEGSKVQFYTSFIIRENSQELYGFNTYEEKELFELLLSVNGVGPKSAFSLISSLGVKALFDAILLENKKILQQAPGIGPKASAQIILSLQEKIRKFSEQMMLERKTTFKAMSSNENNFINETLMACRELGFQEFKVLPIAQSVLASQNIQSAEDLLKNVLQQIRMG
ncbi:MAG: Holliday junction branch migration protein RuvA [Bacteriovoracaceae bacterium]|nr:Holliday junction branch migration protein RuvA [Bacteriovoracaceae bacterium]